MANVQDTSLFAYRKIEPKLTQKQSEVMAVIRATYPICAYEIAKKLGWEINRVTGRVNELRKLGLIKDIGLFRSPTGYHAHYYEPTVKETQC